MKEKKLIEEMNSNSLTDFLNSDYWDIDAPIEEERRGLIIEQLRRLQQGLKSLSIEESQPIANNYFINMIDVSIDQIEKGESRVKVKGILIALLVNLGLPMWLSDEARNKVLDLLDVVGHALLNFALIPTA